MNSYFKGLWWLRESDPLTLFKFQKSYKRWHSKKVSWVALLTTTHTNQIDQWKSSLSLSWRRPISYRNQSIEQILVSIWYRSSSWKGQVNNFALLNTRILYGFILLSFKRICNSTVTIEQRQVALLEHFSNLFISNIQERSSWKKP